ncbi:MAG: hypothetical protein JO119_05180 [Acidobacteria bacterium]|nr:hypothetical protein [Acidobacteriota bacterium]
MRRHDLGELHEQSWFPTALRDAVTNVLQCLLNVTQYHRAVAALLRPALKKAGSSQVVDLCSGAGGPWIRLAEQFPEHSFSVSLTDKYPNEQRLSTRKRQSREISYMGDSLDATDVPTSLSGFQTLFNSAHHFNRSQLKRILENAVRRREGIAIFEVPQRNAVTVGMSILMSVGAFFAVPLVEPFGVSLFFWTYVVPLIPLVMWLDGAASCLRAYTVSEFRELCTAEMSEQYRWSAGILKGGSLVPVTYLIGLPSHEQRPILDGTIR